MCRWLLHIFMCFLPWGVISHWPMHFYIFKGSIAHVLVVHNLGHLSTFFMHVFSLENPFGVSSQFSRHVLHIWRHFLRSRYHFTLYKAYSTYLKAHYGLFGTFHKHDGTYLEERCCPPNSTRWQRHVP